MSLTIFSFKAKQFPILLSCRACHARLKPRLSIAGGCFFDDDVDDEDVDGDDGDEEEDEIVAAFSFSPLNLLKVGSLKKSPLLEHYWSDNGIDNGNGNGNSMAMATMIRKLRGKLTRAVTKKISHLTKASTIMVMDASMWWFTIMVMKMMMEMSNLAKATISSTLSGRALPAVSGSHNPFWSRFFLKKGATILLKKRF